MAFKLGITVDLCINNNIYMLIFIFSGSQWVRKGQKSELSLSIILTTKQAISIKLATAVDFFFFIRDLDFENIDMA